MHYLILCGVAEVLPKLFDRVLILPTVFSELQNPKTPTQVREWAQSLPDWVSVRKPAVLDQSLNIDVGEMEAISLAKEITADAVLIDDRAGRRAAARVGLPVIGTLGLLEQAALRSLIDLPQVIERLRKTNARIDSALIDGILEHHKNEPPLA